MNALTKEWIDKAVEIFVRKELRLLLATERSRGWLSRGDFDLRRSLPQRSSPEGAEYVLSHDSM